MGLGKWHEIRKIDKKATNGTNLSSQDEKSSPRF
jgi:hypothetical protein